MLGLYLGFYICEFNSNECARFFKRSITISALITIIQRLDEIAISKGAQYNNKIIYKTDILDKSQKLTTLSLPGKNC